MKYTQLGRSGLRVSRVVLGTVNFGWVADEASSRAILDRTLEIGCNFIDTANSYNHDRGDLSAESILGRWLQDRPRARDRLVLATKVFGTVGDGPNDGGLSAWHIRRACDDSLRRLRTDRIDLYQLHHIDRRAPWEEVWQALECLVRAGKVLYVGSSNFAAWHIAMAQGVARQHGVLGLVSEQSVYNLVRRTVELEVIPACQALGMGLLAYAPLAGGLLAGDADGAVRRNQESVRSLAAAYANQLAEHPRLCRELGASPTVVALAWLLHRPGVTAAILGPRTVEQLETSVAALELNLSADTLDQLDRLWPGPGGPAPEAYAW